MWRPAGNAVTRFFNNGLEWTIEYYRRTLEWVLRHEALTLLVLVATMVATFWLYIVIPKGFLPQQDTGLIFAVMEGGDEVSFAEMQRLRATVEAAIRKDPEVAGVVSVVGVTPINATPNAARFAITLRPRDVRRTSVMTVIERLQQEMLRIPGVILYFQPVQDIQIATRISRAQYQYTLTGTSAEEVSLWADRLAERLQASPIMRDVASEAQDEGLRLMVNVDRELAGRLGVSLQVVNDTLNSAFGQRQISTIYAQSNQYRVILEAMPQYQSDPNSLSRLYVPGTGGVQVPLSALARFVHTTAPLVIAHYEQFPAVTISFNLAPHASLSDAVATIERGRARDRHADLRDRQLFRRRRRVRALARRPAVADPRGDHRDLHRARRAVREHHPSDHDPVDAAVGGPRRAAGADAARLRSLGHRADRHRAADGHREEERDHDDRLRARSRARAGHDAARFDRAGGAAALPPDHDDDAGRAVRRDPARGRERHRLGAAQPAWASPSSAACC